MKRKNIVVFSVACISALALACGPTPPKNGQAQHTQNCPDSSATYAMALQQAASASSGRTVRVFPASSAAFTASDNYRIGKNGKRQIRVATIVPEKFRDEKDLETKDIKWVAWVSATPDLQQKCKGAPQPVCRAHEVLGMPTIKLNSYVTEFWVNQDDLKRPCKNTSVDTIDCVGRGEIDPIVKQHTDPQQFPFTGRGYTFDWGNLSSPEGVSEFVILGNFTPVAVFDVKTSMLLNDYCK